jgi:hypothetical protein
MPIEDESERTSAAPRLPIAAGIGMPCPPKPPDAEVLS